MPSLKKSHRSRQYLRQPATIPSSIKPQRSGLYIRCAGISGVQSVAYTRCARRMLKLHGRDGPSVRLSHVLAYSDLTSNEWMRIKQHVEKQWPKECLSHSEILRRYILVGIGKLKERCAERSGTIGASFPVNDDCAGHALKS